MEQNKASRVLITVAVMSATVMQALDTTIVNVALPQMQGNLGTTSDQISWVLTSYLVASAIFMPLTGYLTDKLGRRRYLLYSIAGFVFSSMLCGIAQNLTQIVLFRLLQGVFGAALVPLSQAIMADTFPLAERGRAMAIWGMGVMIGPIGGPTLGGWLTDVLDWRWTFYINVPVGLISLLLARRVPDTPRRARGIDWIGLLLLSLGIGGLQFVLDRGNTEDWFESRLIVAVTLATLVGLAGFAMRGMMSRQKPLFDLHIFRDGNFAASSFVITALGLAMYGAMVIQPIMLEGLFHYPTLSTGLVMAPRGIASMLSMMIIGKLVSKVDVRILIGSGILIGATGTWICTHYTLDTNTFWFVWPVLLQGFGLGMIWVPLSTLALSTLPPALTAEAAGLFSLLRTIGSSIGIAVITTFYTRDTQAAWNHLVGFFNVDNPGVGAYLSANSHPILDETAATILAGELDRQAHMVAIVDVYWLITFSFLLMLPLVLMLRQRKGAAPKVAVALE
ncbi:MAG: DHA2 family efflux MFS transporter permease subunit [Paludibacterium sp.]|uniref:DHA2 family efflux MFS transporter permease subunit n=1 Tax=Paludibacterium sp. TaxID=1917523 RepID=UPI0025F13823|nr:DHA2 family efflux MFS transporter permease subunit [Paludibacterium sp.]MBV8047698.1 DHA2 family efflux MFS transporter permease subunit [Paludibacterium sp.]MBV8649649.1 DHA2 family efflux MFS transporter permease subunit [Paludibacterium sp.]